MANNTAKFFSKAPYLKIYKVFVLLSEIATIILVDAIQTTSPTSTTFKDK